jgi:hypothetical protein
MPRNRTIYQSLGVFAGPSPATGLHYSSGNSGVNFVRQLNRVQSANYNFNIARTDINQLGELAAIDRIILEQPTVTMDISYILANFQNEDRLGFTMSSTASGYVSAISGILNKTQDERNYFVKVVGEGSDSVGDAAANYKVIGIGNGFISNYTVEGAVGDFPRASVSFEALNMKIDNALFGPGSSVTGINTVPAVNPVDGTKVTGYFYDLPAHLSQSNNMVTALRPGDITLSVTYDEGGATISDAKIQNFSIGFDLSRTPLQKLGSKYAFSREINFPLSVNFNFTADVGDLTTGNLVDIINNNRSYDLLVQINHPTSGTPHMRYLVKGAKLDSQDFSNSIGSNSSATFTFTAPVGGPQQNAIGIFMSGSTTS